MAAAQATETIRNSLKPAVPDVSQVEEGTIDSYARHIIEEISDVKELIYVMLKGDNGIFLRQLTDLIFEQNLSNAIPFFHVKDTPELRLYYEFISAGLAAFIIKWVLEESIPEDKSAALLADILVQISTKIPMQLGSIWRGSPIKHMNLFLQSCSIHL